MPVRVAALVVALALAACVSAEEQRQFDASVCQNDGFAPGTTDFANCLQRQQLARSQASRPSEGMFGYSCGSVCERGFGGVGVGFGF